MDAKQLQARYPEYKNLTLLKTEYGDTLSYIICHEVETKKKAW